MLFNSYTFLIFFAFVFLVSRSGLPWRLRKFFLLLMSYVFYAAWNPPFVLLLWISTIADWFIAKRIDASPGRRQKHLWMGLSLLVNLGLLGSFKYGTFAIESFATLMAMLGVVYTPPELDIILPVGISFYTFQTLSYSLDICRGNAKPCRSFLDYALFVSFFPQLVAGPIVRAVDFLPQCIEQKRGSLQQVGWGMILLIGGLFNKVVVADSFIAPVVELLFDSSAPLTFFQAWGAAIAFSVQIFCDFSGYSMCAVGVALSLGFVFPANFRAPYAAIGFSDFWRRWHISLSTWLRDYLYISLGGNRVGVGRALVNLMVTMLIGGLWHGASWLFVIWGGIHGLYLVIERCVVLTPFAQLTFWRKGLSKVGLSLCTYVFVCFAWVPFRADELNRVRSVWGAMFGANGIGLNGSLYVPRTDYVIVGVVCTGMLLMHQLFSRTTLESVIQRIPWWCTSIVVFALVCCVAMCMSGEDRAFIYFQF